MKLHSDIDKNKELILQKETLLKGFSELFQKIEIGPEGMDFSKNIKSHPRFLGAEILGEIGQDQPVGVHQLDLAAV